MSMTKETSSESRTTEWQNLPEDERAVPPPVTHDVTLSAKDDYQDYRQCPSYDGDDCWKEPCPDCDIQTIPPDERGNVDG